MIEDKRAKAIYNAAIYAARSEGKSKEVKGSLVARFTKGPWFIGGNLLRDPESAPKELKLIFVDYKEERVFEVSGHPGDPILETLKPGDWQNEMLEKWGPHPDNWGPDAIA
jgi:hypothetical protein